MAKAFQLTAFQWSAFQVGQTVVGTSKSPHPINCIMSGEGEIKDGWRRILEFDVPPDKKTETVRASSSGAKRLSKTAPSFTAVTKRGDRFH